jgi:hypothetical protein
MTAKLILYKKLGRSAMSTFISQTSQLNLGNVGFWYLGAKTFGRMTLNGVIVRYSLMV